MMNKSIQPKHAVPILLLLALTALSACERDALGPPRDVPYYKAHADERASVLAKCAADPGRYDTHANCVNASEAEFKRLIGRGGGVPRPPRCLGLTAEECKNVKDQTTTEK